MPSQAPPDQQCQAPETDAQRRQRQLDMLRELAELNMQAARIAAQQILRPGQPGQPTSPAASLTLARATRAVTQIIALENRVAAGETAARAPTNATATNATPTNATPGKAHSPAGAPDPRRAPLRQALYKSTDSEPNRTARNQLRHQVDERIEEELAADPDCELPLGEIIFIISEDFAFPFDPNKLPDAFLVPPPKPSRLLQSSDLEPAIAKPPDVA